MFDYVCCGMIVGLGCLVCVGGWICLVFWLLFSVLWLVWLLFG